MKEKQQSSDSKVQAEPKIFIGALLGFSWVIASIIQSEIELFLLLGILSLLFTVILRISARRKNKLGMESEGGVFGYLFIWFLANFFYNKLDSVINIDTNAFLVNDVMKVYLIIIVIAWFAITEKVTVQELLFGLPPLYSRLILNLWKLAVIFELLCALALPDFKEYANIFFFFSGYFELVLFYTRQLKIDYLDIILNPIKLVMTLLAGIFVTLKWFLLVLIMAILGQFEISSLPALVLIAGAIFVGIIVTTTNIIRLVQSGGFSESQINKGKDEVPIMFQEIKTIAKTENLANYNEMYLIDEEIKFKRKNEIITLSPNYVLLKIPFSDDLEKRVGVFAVSISRSSLYQRSKGDTSGKWLFRLSDNDKDVKLRKSSVNMHRFSKEEWNSITTSITSCDIKKLAEILNISEEKLRESISTLLQEVIRVQDYIRNRIRGLPDISKETIYTTKLSVKNSIDLPIDILEKMKALDIEEIEIIPGKDDFLFYARHKKQIEKNTE